MSIFSSMLANALALLTILGSPYVVSHDSVQYFVFGVGFVILFIGSSASKSVRNANDKTDNKLTSFNDMLLRFGPIADNLSDNDQAALLKKLAEELRYTDATATVEADFKIEKAISALELELQREEPKSDEISNLIIAINSAINERKTQIKSKKRGRI